MSTVVLLLPVGRPSREDLENLASDLSAMGLPCSVDHAVPLPQDAYELRRNQYLANALLGLAARAAHAPADPRARVLAVTEADLYAGDLNFVFGVAQSRGPAAVISLCRLGLGADPPLRRERALKEAVHELGHTLGFAHCPNAKMRYAFQQLARRHRPQGKQPLHSVRAQDGRPSHPFEHLNERPSLRGRPIHLPREYAERKTVSGGTLPTCEYRCETCGEIFEQRKSIAEHETAKPQCPKCGGEKVTRAFSAFYAKSSKKS